MSWACPRCPARQVRARVVPSWEPGGAGCTPSLALFTTTTSTTPGPPRTAPRRVLGKPRPPLPRNTRTAAGGRHPGAVRFRTRQPTGRRPVQAPPASADRLKPGPSQPHPDLTVPRPATHPLGTRGGACCAPQGRRAGKGASGRAPEEREADRTGGTRLTSRAPRTLRPPPGSPTPAATEHNPVRPRRAQNRGPPYLLARRVRLRGALGFSAGWRGLRVSGAAGAAGGRAAAPPPQGRAEETRPPEPTPGRKRPQRAASSTQPIPLQRRPPPPSSLRKRIPPGPRQPRPGRGGGGGGGVGGRKSAAGTKEPAGRGVPAVCRGARSRGREGRRRFCFPLRVVLQPRSLEAPPVPRKWRGLVEGQG
jgi:hypothetical protein